MSTFYDSVDDVLFTNREWKHIEKYRNLDDYGKETIDIALDRETHRVQQLQGAQKESPAAVIGFLERADETVRLLEYFHSVSAETGQIIFDDVYSERIPIPDIPKYRRVAYAVKVSGHSMEPLYYDNDILLIEPTCEIEIEEIGIFNVDGQAYVKKIGEHELISLNRGYDNIPFTEGSHCMGRVVDKLS